MKIIKQQLRKIIKEELTKLTEGDPWGGPSYDEQWQEEKAGYHGAEPSANILPAEEAPPERSAEEKPENGGKSPHLGKSVDEIADWHIIRWDKNRRDYRLALGQEMSDMVINEMVDSTIASMKGDPSIKDEFYPHLSEVEYNKLIRILEEDRRMNTPR